MQLTERDVRVVRDLALSHVLSRDQLLALGYFGSVTRANTRLRGLRSLKLVRLLETPFFSQSLYSAGPRARTVVGERIAPLLAHREPSPRFLQHALAVTGVRIALLQEPNTIWRFEQQLRTQFRFAGEVFEVRPDGLLLRGPEATLIEVDLGHVAKSKFRQKLRGFDALLASGRCRELLGVPSFSVLTVTTGPKRAAALRRLLPKEPQFPFTAITAADLGIAFPGGWS